VVLYQLSYACVKGKDKKGGGGRVNRFLKTVADFLADVLQFKYQLVPRLHRQRHHARL